MLRTARLTPLLLALLLVGPALAEEHPAGNGIAWCESLTAGLKEARESGKILMICVNAKQVDGKSVDEPAAKGLREVVYRNSLIVNRAKDFVCVYLTPESGSTAYAELSVLGIGGEIVSPQHIFVNPEGDRVLYRKEYWSHGKGDKAILALLKMMDKAEGKSTEPAPTPGEEAGEAAPADDEARTQWIADMIKLVLGNFEEREKGLKALIAADKDGDCTDPLIALLSENKKNTDLLWDLIRALGIDGLEAAAKPIAEFLMHREESIRANAAVSLEYIGSRDKKVVQKLMSGAGKQKDEGVANHYYRAIGRCGVGDAKARALLLKMTGAGKSEFATFGPAIGLAYFTGDEKAARGVEMILKQIGMPGGRRGGGQNGVKRGLLSWTLASIADPRSAVFVHEELLAPLDNMKAFWVEPMRGFWENVAAVCEGDQEAMGAVEGGVKVIKRFAGGTWVLKDDARCKRDNSKFTPKADDLLDTDEDN